MSAFPDIPGYQLLRSLGEGSYGAVYEARQLQLNRVVALKVVHPGAGDRSRVAARFKREGQILSKLRHPGIVGLLDAGTTPAGLWFLAMEFVEGRPLSEAMDARWPWPRAVELARALAEALAAAHAQGVVHRDIKPSNLLLDARQVPKIADFGLSTLAQRGATRLTRSGATPGTPLYLPPEAVEGREQGPAGDVYALASTLAQLILGEPILGWIHTPADLHRRCLVPAPRLPPALAPPWLADTVAACLERDPELRPTAPALAAALADHKAPPGAPRASTLAVARRFLDSTGARGRPGRLPLAPALLALALGLGFALRRDAPPPPPDPVAPPATQDLVRAASPPRGMVLAGRRIFPLLMPEGARRFMPGSPRESSDLFVTRERDPDLAATGWPDGGLSFLVAEPAFPRAALVVAALVLDGDPRKLSLLHGEGRSDRLADRAAPADSPGTRLAVLTLDPGRYAAGRFVLRPQGPGAGRILGLWWGFTTQRATPGAELEILAAELRLGAVLLALRLDAAAAAEGAALDPISGFFDIAWSSRLGIHRERGLTARAPHAGWVEGLLRRAAEARHALEPGPEPRDTLAHLVARWHLTKALTVLSPLDAELDRDLPVPLGLEALARGLDRMTRAKAPVEAGEPPIEALRAAARAAALGPWLDYLVERAILDGRSAGYGLPLDGGAALDRVMSALARLPGDTPPALLGPASLARELVFLAGGSSGATGQPVPSLGPGEAASLEARALAYLAALPRDEDRDRELVLARELAADRARRQP